MRLYIFSFSFFGDGRGFQYTNAQCQIKYAAPIPRKKCSKNLYDIFPFLTKFSELGVNTAL